LVAAAGKLSGRASATRGPWPELWTDCGGGGLNPRLRGVEGCGVWVRCGGGWSVGWGEAPRDFVSLLGCGWSARAGRNAALCGGRVFLTPLLGAPWSRSQGSDRSCRCDRFSRFSSGWPRSRLRACTGIRIGRRRRRANPRRTWWMRAPTIIWGWPGAFHMKQICRARAQRRRNLSRAFRVKRRRRVRWPLGRAGLPAFHVKQTRSVRPPLRRRLGRAFRVKGSRRDRWLFGGAGFPAFQVKQTRGVRWQVPRRLDRAFRVKRRRRVDSLPAAPRRSAFHVKQTRRVRCQVPRPLSRAFQVKRKRTVRSWLRGSRLPAFHVRQIRSVRPQVPRRLGRALRMEPGRTVHSSPAAPRRPAFHVKQTRRLRRLPVPSPRPAFPVNQGSRSPWAPAGRG